MLNTLIILAGGDSRRFEGVGEYIPKSLLPIFQTSLLEKQIQQALAAGFKEILISTRLNFFEQIKSRFVSNEVTVIENEHHRVSSYTALNHIFKTTDLGDQSVLVSLADIYFLSDLFASAINSKVTTLYACEPFIEYDLETGGVVFADTNGYMSHIAVSPIEGNKEGYKWCGLATIDQKHRQMLDDFIASKVDEFPEEDFFKYLTDKNEKVEVKILGDFINNNTQDDLFLSGLYEFVRSKPGILNIEQINQFRENLINLKVKK